MSNNIKQELDTIVIPSELHNRSKRGIQQAKSELQGPKRRWSRGIIVAASLLILYMGFDWVRSSMDPIKPNDDHLVVTEDGAIEVPAIQLPDSSENADMIGLIVYNGKIYTQTDTKIDTERAQSLIGERLGTTKGNIDEWSKQDEYDVEFASTIGETDVYTVKGYDKNFRIMSYTEYDGEVYSEFYECLNGIVVHDGMDVFGNLMMTDNVVSAQYQRFSDWYNSTVQFETIEDMNLLNTFVKELNHAVPHSRLSIEAEIGDFRNDEEFRSMTIQLRDGSNVRLVVIKDGYVFYGHTSLYFKMDSLVFAEVWETMSEEDPVTNAEGSSDLAEHYKGLNELRVSASDILEVSVLDDTETIQYGGLPFTVTKAKVLSNHKGNPNVGDEVRFIETGGMMPSGQEMKFNGIPVMKPGENLILFAKEYVGPIAEDVLIPLGVYQGKFLIKDNRVEQQAPAEDKLIDYEVVTKELFEEMISATNF